MSDLLPYLALFAGLALRLGIPVALTILAIWWFNRLDNRWQESAEQDRSKMAPAPAGPVNVGCWEIKKCSPQRLATCPAYARKDTPCWQVFRDDKGLLKEGCLGCRVFQEAPVPVTA